jgi:hypothetical protein
MRRNGSIYGKLRGIRPSIYKEKIGDAASRVGRVTRPDRRGSSPSAKLSAELELEPSTEDSSTLGALDS